MSMIEMIVKLMVKSNIDACYLIIRFWGFSLDFTERVTYLEAYTVYYSTIYSSFNGKL